jgi:heme exporter protein C
LLAVFEIPLVHFSVVLWRSLHQEASVLSTDGDIKMDDLMLFTLLVGVVGFTALFMWLVSHRQRVMALRDIVESRRIDVAMAERVAEGTPS